MYAIIIRIIKAKYKYLQPPQANLMYLQMYKQLDGLMLTEHMNLRSFPFWLSV